MTDLRRKLRKQRKRVSRFEQRQSEQKIIYLLSHYPNFNSSKHIGIYLDAFGEIYTKKLIEYAFSKGKKVYLPKICNMNKHLVWIPITRHQYRNKRFAHHPLGMKEPMATRGMSATKLDLVIMPLLACDYLGTRIGMGGGFYDRTLSRAFKYPHRVGLAHSFQFTHEKLKREKWDKPLDALIIPTKLLRFKR